jgi:hypothetical protein
VAVGVHFLDFDERELDDAHAWGVGERISVLAMFGEGGAEDGQGRGVDPKEEFFGGGRALDFVEENFEGGIGRDVEAEGRFAHFADALAQRRDVLGAAVGVEREGHLQLVDRLGGEARNEDFVEAFEGVVEALEPAHTLFDREARTPGLIECGETRERGQTVEGLVGAHGGGEKEQPVSSRAVRGEATTAWLRECVFGENGWAAGGFKTQSGERRDRAEESFRGDRWCGLAATECGGRSFF